jgi:hypothetical protein
MIEEWAGRRDPAKAEAARREGWRKETAKAIAKREPAPSEFIKTHKTKPSQQPPKNPRGAGAKSFSGQEQLRQLEELHPEWGTKDLVINLEKVFGLKRKRGWVQKYKRKSGPKPKT